MSSDMVEEDGGGWGGGRRRTEEAGVERVFWRPHSTNGEMEVERKGGTMSSGRADVYYTTFFLYTLLVLQVQRFVGQQQISLKRMT